MNANKRNYLAKTEQIYHMNALMRSLNDENAVESWLSMGVPDGVETLRDVREAYPFDEYFDDDYDGLVALFAKIVSSQTKNGTDSKSLFAS